MGLFDEYLDNTETTTTKRNRTNKPLDENVNGVDPEEYQSLQDKKLEQEIRKLTIANDKELGKLIPRDMVRAILAEIAHSMKTNFIDLPRRESPTLAAKLGIPEKERELEKEWSDLNGNSLESVIDTINRLNDDEVFI